MQELTMKEIELVNGGVDQGTAISSQLGIVAIGVGIMVAGATAPVWFSAGMIGASISITYSNLFLSSE
ncbi:hypothetical protein Sps_04666 [Shewanella psychrophila]|uniref:Uncharacterized protein n=1 Tax=Shewanella psychrophila TaxID=225848 RepID=A0A1S6HW75_9GAMM|nr:hypothetical protein [Shewanella psychrophila]AQS39749.1 hypothetical protein Sps_04666 [Shewanella psychrophila]